MGIKSILSKPLAHYIVGRQWKWMCEAGVTQANVMRALLANAKNTLFGTQHHFKDIHSHKDFVKNVPIRDYEDIKDYIVLIKQGQSDVLWKGKPAYFAKTSGTTSGVKYIPITSESIACQIAAARDALLNYVVDTGKSTFLDGNLMFLSGSPEVQQEQDIMIGRLSGIVNHHIPNYLKGNQVPTFATNCIEDWEQKLDKIVDESLSKKMTLISGIPPWVQMYFDKIQERTGKSIHEVFPQFSLMVHGGVNFEPYQKKLFQSIGKSVDSIETFPASEGFFAFQDKQSEDGLLLLLNSGIFYEFVPIDEYFSPNPTRLTIEEVELNTNYALIISTNAGLWAYSIGDTIKFVSKNPYKIKVTGRIKHFISAFGEHVIAEEVERALQKTLQHFPEVAVTEFTVAPYVAADAGKSYHEWLIAFAKIPQDSATFATALDEAMIHANSYYSDLIKGNILLPLKITSLQSDAFIHYMKAEGKLGGQNKVPRLSNDRLIADELHKWIKK